MVFHQPLSLWPFFRIALICCSFLVFLPIGNTQQGSPSTDGDDVLVGTVNDDEIDGGKGNDILSGDNGNDVLRGGAGNDVLNGGNGNDILDGGPGLNQFYGGPGADQFIIPIDDHETDEVMDFSPEENDTVFLRRKYYKDISTAESDDLQADGVRIDDDGDIEVRLNHRDWTRVVRLHEKNLDLSSQELTDGILLTFTRRF